MSALFDPGREGILDETVLMSSGNIKAMLVLSSYTFTAAHKFVTDLGAADNGRTVNLSGKTFTSGVFDATDTSLTATAAAACNAIILFRDTGVDATSRLVAYADVTPFIPSASQTVNITWNNGANKIFKL